MTFSFIAEGAEKIELVESFNRMDLDWTGDMAAVDE